MSEITRVGADLAKSVIQIHAVDAAGKVVSNRPLPRNKFMAWCVQLPSGCLIAMEASSSAHHWARKLVALRLDARITASAVVATVGDFRQFKNGAQFGAWLGLTPRQNSSGGKNSLGRITKRGDMYLRTLLIQGAKSIVLSTHKRDDPISKWGQHLREKSGWQKAVVALANKNARILWAVFARGTPFDAHHVSIKPTGSVAQSGAVPT